MTSDKADRGLNPNIVHNRKPNCKSPMNLNSNPPDLVWSHAPTTLQFMIERTCSCEKIC